jgi:hypothetical protein
MLVINIFYLPAILSINPTSLISYPPLRSRLNKPAISLPGLQLFNKLILAACAGLRLIKI